MMNIADFVIGYEEFKAQYIEAANSVESATVFWNTYNIDPNGLVRNRQFLLLRDRLFGLLKACKRIDAETFTKIHKGHPYYFIGIASYLLDDFQTAIYFFDAAVTEDINAGRDPKYNPTPATRFLMLEGEPNNQAARELTRYAQSKVERALAQYNNKITKNPEISLLTLEELRKDFIYYALMVKDKPGLRTLVTSFITYCIEWDIRNEHFEYEVKAGTSEPFFLHLFKGCILLESLLKYNRSVTPKGKMLGPILKEKRITEALRIVAVKPGDYDLDAIFDKLLKFDNSIDDALQISYMARNTLGHSLGWNTNITQTQYRELYLIIASSCLHVINCLWKQ